jgi:hypothetical protein
MVLDWIRVGFTRLILRQKCFWMPCSLKLLPTVLYDGGQFEIADPFRDLLLCWQRFCTCGFTKRQFNTFILKNKLIAKSVEGSLHNPKSQV